MKKKRDLGLLWFYIILMLSVLMVNPPILPFVNTYCAAHPMTFGWPTLFLWLEFWYAVGFSMGCASPEIVGLDPVSKGHPARQAGRAGEVTG